jgi:hypothetical protein
MGSEPSIEEQLKSASKALTKEAGDLRAKWRERASKDEIKEAQEEATVNRSLLRQLAAEVDDIRGRYLATR